MGNYFISQKIEMPQQNKGDELKNLFAFSAPNFSQQPP
jgi:hypothetical protein